MFVPRTNLAFNKNEVLSSHHRNLPIIKQNKKSCCGVPTEYDFSAIIHFPKNHHKFAMAVWLTCEFISRVVFFLECKPSGTSNNGHLFRGRAHTNTFSKYCLQKHTFFFSLVAHKLAWYPLSDWLNNNFCGERAHIELACLLWVVERKTAAGTSAAAVVERREGDPATTFCTSMHYLSSFCLLCLLLDG